MTLETLPHEVSALVSAGVRVPAPPAVEGPVTQILTIAGQIERETNLLVFQLEEYLRLLTSLAAAKGVMLDVAGRTESYARLVGGRELKMADKADAMAYQIIEVSEKVTPALRGLPERMSGLQELVLELRFTVALMRLLTLMVGRFARSVLDGSEEEPVGSMNDLCAALDAGFARLGPLCKEVEQARKPTASITGQDTFRAGMTAAVCIMGLAWLGNAFVNHYEEQISHALSGPLQMMPWLVAVFFYLTAPLMFSHAATTRAFMPLMVGLGLPSGALVASYPAVANYYLLPNYPTTVAAMEMDDTGSTRVGRFVLAHPFILPGTASIIVCVALGFLMAHFLV